MAKKLVFILGAGGHAKMAIETLASMAEYQIVSCMDKHPSSEQILGYPVCSEKTETLAQLLEAKALALVALGDNRLREQVTANLKALGFQFATAIAHSAYVSPSAQIGPGSVVMPRAVVGAMAKIGHGVILNTSCSVDHDSILGDFVHIAPGCHLAGGVSVDQGAMLGIGTCVIPNRHIGAWSILGANSTVVRDIPPHSTYVGTPACELNKE